MPAFLQMDGYGGYVWTAVAITLLVLISLFLASWRDARVRDAELAELRRRVRGTDGMPVRRPVLRRD